MWEEIEDFIDSEVEVCPECGAPLNDGGTCPKCDDGEEEYGIA
jgi:rubrerythrin